MADNASSELWRVKESFAVPGPDGGIMRPYPAGAMIAGSDPIATTHRAFLEPAAASVEQATAAPGQRRSLGSLRLPSGVTQHQAVEHRTGHAHTTGASQMVHTLPPEDVNSPASVFAPSQPGMGVVADDVPDSQNLEGKPRAADQTAKLAAEISQARQSSETPEDPLVADLTGETEPTQQGEDEPGTDAPEEQVAKAEEAPAKESKARGSRRRANRQQDGSGQNTGTEPDGTNPGEGEDIPEGAQTPAETQQDDD